MTRVVVLRRLLVTTTTLALSVGALSGSAQAEPTSPDPGVVRAWGYNQFGETDPPASLEGQDVLAVSGGFLNSLALTSDGKVTAWGYSEGGKSQVPASLADQLVVAIAAGIRTSYAVTSQGTIVSWGGMNPGDWTVPASLTGKQVTAIAAHRNAIALTDDGHVTTWNYAGTELSVPSGVALETFTSVDTSEGSFFGVTTGGKVIAWGDNATGQTDVPASLADKVVIEVVGSETSALALTADGQLVAWGDRPHPWHMFQDPTGQASIPASLAGQVVVDIAAGSRHSLALTSDGQVHVWGQTYWTGSVPADLVGITAMAAGDLHSIVVTRSPQSFAPGPNAAITGTPQVGHELSAAGSADAVDPATDTTFYRWFADDVWIPGATSATFTPTTDQLDATLRVQVTAARNGYNHAVHTSQPTEAVAPGVLTLPPPVVSGTPTVDQQLTVGLSDDGPALSPDDAQVTYTWHRDTALVATGETYSPTADDAGHTLRVTATATRAGYDDATAGVDTAIAQAEFSTKPTPAIGGTLQVGETLTASTGPIAPTPAQVDHQWYADGDAILGATSSELVVDSGLAGAKLTVSITAHRPGYAAASGLSAPSAPVATSRAPGVVLETNRTRLRRGQSTTISWILSDATAAQALGSWSGIKPVRGSVSVDPRALGAHTYRLTATNENGTTTAQVTIRVIREAEGLTVARPTGIRLAGRRVIFTGRGLDRGEAYTIRMDGQTLAKGYATDTGRVARRVTIPAGTPQGRNAIRLSGSERDRTGATRIWVVTRDGMRVRLAQQEVRASDSQTVTVTGLAPSERVRVTYRGERVSARGAHANAYGRYRVTFKVGTAWGEGTVKAIGAYDVRRSVRVFQVVRRCSGESLCD